MIYELRTHGYIKIPQEDGQGWRQRHSHGTADRSALQLGLAMGGGKRQGLECRSNPDPEKQPEVSTSARSHEGVVVVVH